jgi:hypothetical protein
MAEPASSDYHRGEQDISEQVSTFHLVMNMTKWGSLATAVVILFFTMLFATESGFLGSLFASLVVMVVVILVLRDRAGGH